MRKTSDLTRIGNLLPQISLPEIAPVKRVPRQPPPGMFELAIRPEDIGYTHPIFVQCFMPVRHHANNARRWQTDCGRASMVIRAGELLNPHSPGEFKECVVPAGPKARLLNAYITDYALRHRTPVIPLGDSLREAMAKMSIPIGGQNGKELQRELENLASAEIMLGVWSEDGTKARQKQTKIAGDISFWIDKDVNQRTLWQQEMQLSADYYRAVTEDDRMAPVYWPAMIGLQNNPRAMDIHSFLVYRLRSGLERPVTLPMEVLHSMFGKDIKLRKHFIPRFRDALAEAHKWYPTARAELLKDGSGLTLKSSPALIPYRKMARLK